MSSRTSHPVVATLCVGRPRTLSPEGASGADEAWTTGIFKAPVVGSHLVERTGIAGDGQADLENHGGPDKAVCAYSTHHYPAWRSALGIEPFEHGAFGENLTIEGLDESTVCIGDVWSAGGVEFEVSQPRQPCWKLGRKWHRPSLPQEVVAAGRTGWYFRVRQPGRLEAGSELRLVQRVNPVWTIDAANDVMHHRRGDLAALAALDALSASWRTTLANRLRHGTR